MKHLILALALFPLFASAQNVRVGKQPSAVFSPTPGGYILRQPGPAHNISLTPQPVTPPSAGIKGVGAFSGGQRFRLNGQDFEMGGTYDMPLPKTNQKAPVTAVSKVPKPAMAKALLKTLPFLGNAIAVGEILDQMASEWDAKHPEPGNEAITNPATGEVYRSTSSGWWELGGNRYGSAGQACSSYFKTACGSPTPEGQPPPPRHPASAVALGPLVYVCTCPPSDGVMGSPSYVEAPPVKQQIPDDVLDDVASDLSDSQVEQLLDHAQNGPNGDKLVLDLPSDLPTEVTGPASVPDKTSTTTNADGSTTTNTTTTNITYNDNTIRINNTTSITNRAPDGSVSDTSETVESDVTPSQPSEQVPPVDVPGLCEEFPDILACKKLESPDNEPNPKSSENVTLQTGPTFDGGGCIPDVTVSVFGTQVTALSMAVPCGWIVDYLKPLILLLASLSAVFIIYPRTD